MGVLRPKHTRYCKRVRFVHNPSVWRELHYFNFTQLEHWSHPFWLNFRYATFTVWKKNPLTEYFDNFTRTFSWLSREVTEWREIPRNRVIAMTDTTRRFVKFFFFYNWTWQHCRLIVCGRDLVYAHFRCQIGRIKPKIILLDFFFFLETKSSSALIRSSFSNTSPVVLAT